MGARLGWQSLMISANRASAQACPNELAAPRSSGADVHVCRYCKRPIYPVLPGRDGWSAPSGHLRPRMCSHAGSGPCNRRGARKWPSRARARDGAHGFLLSFHGDIFVPSGLTRPPSVRSSFIRPPCVPWVQLWHIWMCLFPGRPQDMQRKGPYWEELEVWCILGTTADHLHFVFLPCLRTGNGVVRRGAGERFRGQTGSKPGWSFDSRAAVWLSSNV